MGNITMPTPVALAGAAICVLGGYLVGAITGPDTPSRTTAEVASYDPSSSTICLTGDNVDEQEGQTEDGQLCGIWRRAGGDSTTPRKGDKFRFVSLVSTEATEENPDAEGRVTIIYGDVVP